MQTGYNFHTYTAQYYMTITKTCISVTNETKHGCSKTTQGGYSQLAPFTQCNWNNQDKEGEIGWAFSMHGEGAYVHSILVGKPEARAQLR
jgi:hypothetical protein